MQDPINLIDSNGLSAEDVKRIQNIFNNSVARMTAAGQRRSPGWLNNMSRSLNDLTEAVLAHHILGVESRVISSKATYKKDRMTTLGVLSGMVCLILYRIRELELPRVTLMILC